MTRIGSSLGLARHSDSFVESFSALSSFFVRIGGNNTHETHILPIHTYFSLALVASWDFLWASSSEKSRFVKAT